MRGMIWELYNKKSKILIKRKVVNSKKIVSKVNLDVVVTFIDNLMNIHHICMNTYTNK